MSKSNTAYQGDEKLFKKEEKIPKYQNKISLPHRFNHRPLFDVYLCLI